MRTQMIVIPSYKPNEVLIQIVKDLKQYFADIVVVDDGGGTEYQKIFEIIESFGCTVLRHAVNQGKGRGLKTAFSHYLLDRSHSDGVITVDGDGQHRMEDILKVSDEMQEYPNDVIIGCRSFKDRNIPFRSRFGNTLSRVLYKWACGLDVSDTQTGLRGIPDRCLPICCKTVGEKYEYETNMLLAVKDNGYVIREIEIQTIYEDGNKSSHFDPIRDSLLIYAVVIKYSISSLLASIIDHIIFFIAFSFGMPIIMATYTARVFSCIVNFLVNKKLVFAKNGQVVLQFIKYIILAVISGGISGIFVMGLVDIFGEKFVITIKALVEILLYFFNYEVQRMIVFTGNKENGWKK